VDGAVGKVIPLRRGPKRPRDLSEEQQYQLRRVQLAQDILLDSADAVEQNLGIVLLAKLLGYVVKSFHKEMLAFQYRHPDSLQLAYRGSGKTTLCTVVKAIHLLLVDPNLRILLASDIKDDAKKFLREIKPHFENNQKLIEIFGPYYDPQLVTKWDTEEINVLPRTKHTKEASIACVGADTAVASRHVDVIFSDDLVVEKNSRTKGRRDKLKTWNYQSLDPCLEPPDPEVPHRGEHHRLGTRYHWDELNGHLIGNELKNHHRIYRGLDENEKSPWPEKHSPEWFKKKRKKMGAILFAAQHLCDTELMKGEIFQYDDCQLIDADEVPSGLRKFTGTDLAVGKKVNDQFAQVAIGIEDKTSNIYVLEAYAAHLRFKQQKAKWKEMYKRHDPIRAGIESNGYQDVMRGDLKDDDKDLRAIPIHTKIDKVTRAQKLSAVFEDKRVFLVRGTHVSELIDQLVLFPGYNLDDLFDALDIAIRTSRKRKRRASRENEPGLSW